MKNIIALLILVFSYNAKAQNDAGFFAALKSSDVITLETYLENNIDFCLFEDQQILPKKVAMVKLKNFLDNQKILSIDVMHKGVSKDKSSQYKVAKIVTSKDTFRVFVYASGEIGAKTVKEIRIDKF